VVSIIVSYHNEPVSFLMTCLNQIRGTSVDAEIIVVDDCSKYPLEPIEGIRIIRHAENRGVGACFDTGVSEAAHDNIVLTACDMRFADNNWLGSLVSDIEANPKSLICTACAVLGEKDQSMTIERKKSYGATILFYHDHKTNPKKHKGFRSIIEAKWYEKQSDEIYEIPCILGACYGVKKSWYQYIDGFWGHSRWGTLEPYISLKSWLFGGNCLIDPKIVTGHIFKRTGTHNVLFDTLVYNKILIATLLFPESERMIRFLGDNPMVRRVKAQIKSIEPKIREKKAEYDAKTVYSINDFIERWQIDYCHRI
jgi:glycosyltransferase involved in cell wall biosynthesis